MKIALVWSYGFDPKYVLPLAVGYLYSNLKDSQHTIRIFDCSLQQIKPESIEFQKFLEEFNPDLISVSCWANTFKYAIETLATAKKLKPSIITIMGGTYPTTYPEPIIENPIVDFIIRGEAELSFPLFVTELEKEYPDFASVGGLIYKKEGKIFKNPIIREKNLDKIKRPDYDIINLKKYIKIYGYRFNTVHQLNAPIWATRGCPYHCDFCSASIQNGLIVRKHSINYLIDWIKDLYNRQGIRHINIIDDNFTFDTEYAKEFCRHVIELNLKNLSFGTPNGVRLERLDDELLNLMKKAKWETIVIAPESGSEKVLKIMKKKLDINCVPEKVKAIKKAGFKIHGFFIIGYPGETEKDLNKTLNLIRKSNFNFFFLNNFQPIPGTPVFDRLVESGEIKSDFLPMNYSNGERSYTPKEMKNINFPIVILKEYLRLVITYPLNFFYMIKIVNPIMAIQKVSSNIKNSIKMRKI